MKKTIKNKIFILLFFIVLFSCYKNDYEDPLLIKARKNFELQKKYFPKKIHIINNTKTRIFFKKIIIKKDFYLKTDLLNNNEIDFIFISGTLNNKSVNQDNEEVKKDIAYLKEMFNIDEEFLKNDRYKSDVKIYKSFFKKEINNEAFIRYNYKYNYSYKTNLKVKGNYWINNKNGLILTQYKKLKMRSNLISFLPQEFSTKTYYFYNKNLEFKKIETFSKMFINFFIISTTAMQFEVTFEDFKKIT